MAKTTAFNTNPLIPFSVDNNILSLYDGTRLKYLTVDRASFSAGRAGRAKNIYLRLIDGQSSNLSGILMPRAGTITAVTASSRGTIEWTVEIRKNKNTSALLTKNTLNGQTYDTTIDVDFDEGDTIELFCATSTFMGIKDPHVWIEVAWRMDA